MRRILFFPVALWLVASCWSDFVHADVTAELVRAAKGQARTVSAEDVSAAKARLLTNVRALRAFLESSDPEQAGAWRELVHFDSMTAELEKEAPSLEVLNRSLVGCREDEAGIELQVFTDVRQSLRDYMNHLVFSRMEEFGKEYDRRIDNLAAQLEAYAAAPSTERGIAIGRSLSWFERSKQISSVTKAVRDRFSHANLHVVASKQLVASGVRDSVDATEPLRDCILGTSIHGTTRLTGNVDLELVSSDDRAAFDITLTGDAVSNNVGYNRGVSIYSTGYTDVRAAKRVYVDALGVTSDATRATAATSSNVSSIAARSCLVERIAWRQVRQKKRQAERIASGKAAGRVARRMDGQAGETVAEGDENFRDKFRSPLVRRESFPELFDLQTTDTHLLLRLLRAGTAQLAAPGPAPELNGEFDLAARVHESIAGNFSESLIGGVMLTDERIVKMYKEAEIEIPEDLKITQDSEPWAITFARSQPIRVEFADGGISVAVRCQYLHQGEEYGVVSLPLKDEKTDKLYRPEIRISREYELTTPNDGGLQLVSQGDLSIEFIDLSGAPAKMYGARHAAAVGFLSKKFNAMLKPKLPEEATDGIALPGQWARIGKLKARLAQASDGWLSIGWEQVLPETPPVEAIADESKAAETLAAAAPSKIASERTRTASLAP